MTTYSIASQGNASKVGSAILRLDPQTGHFKTAVPGDFGTEKVVLFIHGFTADAAYMRPLMEQFSQHGFVALAFNYPCYDYAARSLFQLLEKFDDISCGAISGNRIIVVGHSMGGLISRALVGPEAGYKYVRRVFTLGSPNGGTLQDARALQWCVTWGESISGLIRGGFSKSSKSALQLMGVDNSEPYLLKLQKTPVPAGKVAFHSISGGKNYLTFGKGGGLRERVLNILIQKHFGNAVNDGLVVESSADLSHPNFSICADGGTHHNDYADYAILNHSHLCESQILNLHIISLA
jgi:pimeloyl-ACP methyl ester carboxylesterase